MFGIGGFELFLILLFGFLIFGPDKLPALAKTLGKAIAKFRDAQQEMTGQLNKESFLDKDSDNPIKNPLDVIEKAASNTKKNVDSAKATADEIADAAGSAAASIASSKDSSSSDGASEDKTSTNRNGSLNTTKSPSFAERKAQYDKERAKRKEKEAKEAKAKEEEQKRIAKEELEKRENPKNPVSSKKIQDADDEGGER